MHLLCKRYYKFSGTLIIAQNLGRQTYTLSFLSCAYRSLTGSVTSVKFIVDLYIIGWNAFSAYSDTTVIAQRVYYCFAILTEVSITSYRLFTMKMQGRCT